MEGRVDLPPRAVLQHARTPANAGGAVQSGGAATASSVASRVQNPRATIPGPHASGKRVRPESGPGALPQALKKRKWVAMDE